MSAQMEPGSSSHKDWNADAILDASAAPLDLPGARRVSHRIAPGSCLWIEKGLEGEKLRQRI